MKRIAFVLLLALALVFAFSSMAYANFGPHGGYTQDTDACAGCHRAHTSFSSITYTGQDGSFGAGNSALLVSDATNMTEFCYACHGDGAPGASTNVLMGVFDSGPTGGINAVNPANPVATVMDASNSSYDTTLNGGGFLRLDANPARPVMSSHEMPVAAGSGTKVQGDLVRWGGADLTAMPAFRCTDCHDPHGSSNYRLLKDVTNGITVGGQTAGGVADAYVTSNEEGFPANGFRKGSDGQADVANYVPNYTVPQYKVEADTRGMSTWCSTCHTAYNNVSSSTDYGTYERILSSDGVTYEVLPVGNRVRHRHPVDVALAQGQGPGRALQVELLNDPGLPLEMAAGSLTDFHAASPWTTDSTGELSCLTCHYAHGSFADSTGFAVAALQTGPYGATPVQVTKGNQALPGSAANPLGVNPNFSQAILRYDNRGVCERCHNK